MAGIRCLVVAAVLFCSLVSAFADPEEYDYTLNTVGTTCMNKFETVLADLYPTDQPCQDAIRAAWSSPGENCPSTKQGEQVHNCLAKSEATIARWLDFVEHCEIMNVAVRDESGAVATESESEAAAAPAGESEGESAPAGGEVGGEWAEPSCFPPWEHINDFKLYLEGKKWNGSTPLQLAVLFVTLLALASAAVLSKL